MTSEAPQVSDRPETNSKVGRLIEAYDLDGLGEELEEYWTGEREDQYSLRKLADHFNRQLLRRAMERAGLNPMDNDVESTYDLLTDDEVSEGVRIQRRRRLERDGVDVDRLTSDFVSHQAVHTYLTKYRGASHETDDGSDPVEKSIETLQRLQSRTEAVSENTVDRLKNAGDIDVGEFDVLVDTRVLCQDCGSDYEVIELLERGGCDCE
ncbi:MAG: rod-determining factor RdfA [Haloferacaceae archaeon]